MKAVSIKQPWAYLIASGIKDIENRTWKTHFRGRVYIHASAKIAFTLFTPEQSNVLRPLNLVPDNYSLSAIIGEVDIVDCVINHPSIWAEKSEIQKCKNCAEMKGENVCCLYEGKRNDFIPYASKPIYNWVLANAVLYDQPILNVKGALSFWEPEDCLQECIACGQYLRIEETVQDDGENYYHSHCYDEMLPHIRENAY